MKLKIFIPIALFLIFLTASCLKDNYYMDVTNTSPVIEFGQSPAQGVTGPFVYNGDSTGQADTAIALVLASPQAESDTLQTIVVVDPSQISTFDSSDGSNFTLIPDSLFSISDTVNILPGHRVGSIAVTLKFPGLHNVALPLKISGSYFLHSNTQVVVSGNSGTFMWLFQ